MLLMLVDIITYLINIVVMLVIVQFVLSLLISFNVVNRSNDFVMAVWKAVNALLEPLLAPVRRLMPDTGAIDFSPLLLIVGLTVLQKIADPPRDLLGHAVSAAKVIDGKRFAEGLRARVTRAGHGVHREGGAQGWSGGGAGRRRPGERGLCPQQGQADAWPAAWPASNTHCPPIPPRPR